jgi:hypothetical protein
MCKATFVISVDGEIICPTPRSARSAECRFRSVDAGPNTVQGFRSVLFQSGSDPFSHGDLAVVVAATTPNCPAPLEVADIDAD